MQNITKPTWISLRMLPWNDNGFQDYPVHKYLISLRNNLNTDGPPTSKSIQFLKSTCISRHQGIKKRTMSCKIARQIKGHAKCMKEDLVSKFLRRWQKPSIQQYNGNLHEGLTLLLNRTGKPLLWFFLQERFSYVYIGRFEYVWSIVRYGKYETNTSVACLILHIEPSAGFILQKKKKEKRTKEPSAFKSLI